MTRKEGANKRSTDDVDQSWTTATLIHRPIFVQSATAAVHSSPLHFNLLIFVTIFILLLSPSFFFTLLFLFPSSFFSFHPPSSLFTLLLFSPRSSPFTLLSPFSSSFFSFHPPSPLLLLHLLFPYSVFLILLFSTSFFFHPHSFLHPSSAFSLLLTLLHHHFRPTLVNFF